MVIFWNGIQETLKTAELSHTKFDLGSFGDKQKKWIVWSNFIGGICSTFLVYIIMGLEQEVENVTVPGQGLRRVRNLPLISAIGFSGESVLVFDLNEVSSWNFQPHKFIKYKYSSKSYFKYKKFIYPTWSLQASWTSWT